MKYLETGSTDPYYNLAFEEYVLTQRPEEDWLILWQNDNTIVIGLNQNTDGEINHEFVAEHHINVVRRTTGGGAVYHDMGNLNYSFITDAENGAGGMERFTGPVCRALASMGVQAETSGRNDILVDGKKVSGVAQRICKGRILHHGTLLFRSDSAMISGALKVDKEKFSAKGVQSVRSRVTNIADYLPVEMDIGDFRLRIRQELLQGDVQPEMLWEDELEKVRELADGKYRTWDWNYGRSPRCSVTKRSRFPGGTVELRLEVDEGRIAEVRFFGDYMATEPNDALCAAMRGLRYEEAAVRKTLESFDLGRAFGAVTENEIISLMF